LVQAGFQWLRFAQEFAVAGVVAAARGVFPIDLFQYHLVGLRAVENHSGALAPELCGLKYAPRRGPWQKVAHVRVALLGPDHCAVIDDHRQRRGNLLRHGQGKIVAATGHQRDFDAAARGFGDGFAVGRGNFPTAVEQRAIDIQSDQSNGHNSSVPDAAGGSNESVKKSPWSAAARRRFCHYNSICRLIAWLKWEAP